MEKEAQSADQLPSDLLSKLDPTVGLIHVKPLYLTVGKPPKGEEPRPAHVVGAILGDHEVISILNCVARTPREKEVWGKMYEHSRKRIEVLCRLFEREGLEPAAKLLKDGYDEMYRKWET